MKRINQALVLALVLCVLGGGVAVGAPKNTKALSVGTFNTMLWPWMPFEAADIAAIAATDFDVLVLQEVWTQAAQDEIITAVGEKYPYHYAGSTRPNITDRGDPLPNPDYNGIGCDFSEPSGQLLALANQYISCLIGAGIDTQTVVQPFPNPSPFQCTVYSIQIMLWNFDPASQQCQACLLTSMEHLPNDGVSPFKSIPICGAAEGRRFLMDGTNGILILSKSPITEVSETPFNSWLYNRLNIYATIRGTKFAFVHFGYDVIADAGFPIPTYGDIQGAHVADILAHSPDVVIGDFNSGPDYQPDGYDALISSGYRDLVQPQPFQTWCPPSHLGFQPCINAGSFSTSIDHILVRQDAQGALIGTFATDLISDHIGVSATVEGASPVTHDLAVTGITIPKTITLTDARPQQTKQIKVKIQNRSPHTETIPDLATLDNLVSLTVEALHTETSCSTPTPVLLTDRPQKALPLTLKPKQVLTVVYELTFVCANDPAKTSNTAPGHEDYRFTATVDHSALDGKTDDHPADDTCPRAALGLVPNPDGRLRDRGCAEELTDVVVR